MTLQQTPDPDSYLLRWKGDELVVTLTLDAPRKGRAVLRTNLGAASVRRREIIEETPEITSVLSPEEIEDAFNPAWHLKNVDTIFRQVGLL